MASLEKLKSGPNFIVYQSGEQKLIKIENIRFSYPHFGHKHVDEGDDGNTKESWGGVAMLPKATHVAAKDAFMELVNELQTANKVKIPPEYRCIKNGDEKGKDEYEGHWLINFSDKKRRPAVRDEHGRLMIDPERAHDHEYIAGAIEAIDEKFFGGVWISVLLRPWYFNGRAKNSAKTYPKRLCSGFTGVKFTKNDKPFGGGRIDDSDAWGAPSGGDDDGMSGGSDDDGL